MSRLRFVLLITVILWETFSNRLKILTINSIFHLKFRNKTVFVVSLEVRKTKQSGIFII